MSAHKSTMAQFKTFIEYLPEFFYISARRQRDIGEIQCDNTLVESSVILRQVRLRIDIRSQERAASHAGVAMALTVFIYLQLEHFLFGNVIRYHALCRTFCG